MEGELIDLSLDEGLFRLIDWQVIVADQMGSSPQRAGNQLAFAPGVLVNTYATSDARWLTVTSGTPKSIQNIAVLVGEDVEQYRTDAQRRDRVPELDAVLAEWIGKRTLDDALEAMAGCEVVAAPVLTGTDILTDPLFLERGNILDVEDPELGTVKMHGVVPRLSRRPGAVWRPGPSLGQDTDTVLGDWLGRSADEIASLRAAGTV